MDDSELPVLTLATPPTADAFDSWRSVLCKTFLEMDSRRDTTAGFWGRVELVDAGDVRLTRVRSADITVSRTRRQAVAANSDVAYVLYMHEGRATITQDHHTVPLRPGGLQVVDGYQPFELAFHTPHDVYSYQVDRALLADHGLEQAAVRRRWHRTEPLVRLLIEQMHALNALRTDTHARPTLIRTFVDLVRLSLVAPAAAPDVQSVRSVRRRQVLGAIDAGFRHLDFGVDDVARELQVTPRYVHQLLEPTGQTFGQHLRERRLEWAARELADRPAHRTVADVAADAGFGDLSYFHRCFKERFGTTPAAHPGS